MNPFREMKADFRNLTLYWREGGKENGPLLLFLHGYPDSPEIWNGQLASFASDYRIVCPYGMGIQSEKEPPKERYALDSICLDYLLLLKYLDPKGTQKIMIVGHDLGAPIAWGLGSLLKDRLNCLVVINSMSLAQIRQRLISRPRQLLLSWYVYPMMIPHFPEKIVGKLAAPLLKLSYYLGGLSKDKWPELRSTRDLTRPLQQYRAYIRSLLSETRPRTIKAPVLVLWAKNDPFLLTPSLDEFEKEAKNLTVRIVEGSHWMFREEPSKTNILLRKFFEESEKSHAKPLQKTIAFDLHSSVEADRPSRKSNSRGGKT